MTEKDVCTLIKNDPWMMQVLRTALSYNLPDWMIGAGFVRNKVWDALHGYQRAGVDTQDIDLVYYDTTQASKSAEQQHDAALRSLFDAPWSCKNQARMHHKHGRDIPYKETIEGVAEWVETATSVAVRLEADDSFRIFAPHGIDDLVALTLRPTSAQVDRSLFLGRIKTKRWIERWPKLSIAI